MSCFIDEHSIQHLLGGSPNPNLISETFISKGLLFFFQPSLQTGSSDINPPLSFRPYMFNPSPRDELPPTAISSLLTYIISPRFQFMSSNHNTSGKHNLGLKRIENPSFTTYPKSFAIALYVLSSVPQCLLLPPIVFPHLYLVPFSACVIPASMSISIMPISILFNCHLS